MAKPATKRKRAVKLADVVGADGPPIVYVHGIGAQQAKDDLKREWDLALFGRDMGTRTTMAYWANLLHPTTSESPRSAERVRGRDHRVDIRKALKDAGVTKKRDEAEEFADELLLSIGVTPVPGAGPGKRVLPLPGFLRRPISRIFLEAFVGDTSAYFFVEKTRRDIRARFLSALPADRKAPVIVVAHSQGSIIAYDVLRDAPDRDVHLLMTLGSPLGIQEVQDHLGEPLAVPTCVRAWHNASDPFDPVALDRGLGNDFASNGAVAVRDMVVQNENTRVGFEFNPHSAVGYLAHPKVREIVHRTAQLDPMRRFVVARDVADRLGSDHRVPVLIEVLEPGYRAVDEEQDATDTYERDVEHGEVTLAGRIGRLAKELHAIVPPKQHEAARIDGLKRFVAARLTPSEVRTVAERHQAWRVYAVWRSAEKRKLIRRSAAVLHAPAAQTSYGALGSRITWAVLDTGAKQDHPHFLDAKGQPRTIRAVWDCTTPGAPKRIPLGGNDDGDGHGTHVSGIIAGCSPTTVDPPFVGLAPAAQLVVYKVLDDDGAGEDAWIIKALDHIAETNENNAELAVHGVNLSLGGPFDSSVYGCGFSPICVELRRLWRQGVLVCVAAGNEGELSIDTSDGEFDLHTQISIGDPANLEDCIAVGSVNADRPHLYGISSFSSRGPTADGRPKPDCVAPGERIDSCNARFRRNKDGVFANLYYRESGTSMATPHVSGLLAAFLSARREFIGRPDEVKEIMLRTCTDLGRDRYHQGHGMPNLMKMLLDV